MKRNRRRAATVADVLVVVMLLMFIGAIIGTVCWPYTINTWLVYAGKPPAIAWWQGSLMGFVPLLGLASVPTAVLTWALMLFLG